MGGIGRSVTLAVLTGLVLAVTMVTGTHHEDMTELMVIMQVKCNMTDTEIDDLKSFTFEAITQIIENITASEQHNINIYLVQYSGVASSCFDRRDGITGANLTALESKIESFDLEHTNCGETNLTAACEEALAISEAQWIPTSDQFVLLISDLINHGSQAAFEDCLSNILQNYTLGIVVLTDDSVNLNGTSAQATNALAAAGGVKQNIYQLTNLNASNALIYGTSGFLDQVLNKRVHKECEYSVSACSSACGRGKMDVQANCTLINGGVVKSTQNPHFHFWCCTTSCGTGSSGGGAGSGSAGGSDPNDIPCAKLPGGFSISL